MPLSQTSSRCKHLDQVTWREVVSGHSIFYRGICVNCGLLGYITISKLGAIRAFWKQNKENSMNTSDYRRGVEDALKLWDFIKDSGWKQPQDIIKQETNMAQTYEQGFKEGVEAAGRKILEELPLSGITDPVDVLNAIPRFLRKKFLLTKKVTKWGEEYMNSEDYKRGVWEASKELTEGTLPSSRLFKVAFDEEMRLRRKKLLTKRVTKWTGVITSEWGGKPAILDLCDSFEEANGFLLKNPKPLAGPIPIEIEVPL